VADPDVAEAMARSFLGKLPLELVDELLAEGERTSYPAGTTIYREGDAPRAVLVIDGLLRVYMTSAEGRQVTVRYARDADVLGIAVLVGGPVNVAVQALAPSSLFRINARTLTQAARQDARVAWAVAEELNRRLYDTLRRPRSTPLVRCGSGWPRTCWTWRPRSSVRRAAWWHKCHNRSLPTRWDPSGRWWPASCGSSVWRGWWRRPPTAW
jgi:CRP-like cAMP-binding protein